MREDTWLVLERRQNALVAKLPSLTGVSSLTGPEVRKDLREIQKTSRCDSDSDCSVMSEDIQHSVYPVKPRKTPKHWTQIQQTMNRREPGGNHAGQTQQYGIQHNRFSQQQTPHYDTALANQILQFIDGIKASKRNLYDADIERGRLEALKESYMQAVRNTTKRFGGEKKQHESFFRLMQGLHIRYLRLYSTHSRHLAIILDILTSLQRRRESTALIEQETSKLKSSLAASSSSGSSRSRSNAQKNAAAAVAAATLDGSTAVLRVLQNKSGKEVMLFKGQWIHTPMGEGRIESIYPALSRVVVQLSFGKMYACLRRVVCWGPSRGEGLDTTSDAAINARWNDLSNALSLPPAVERNIRRLVDPLKGPEEQPSENVAQPDAPMDVEVDDSKSAQDSDGPEIGTKRPRSSSIDSSAGTSAGIGQLDDSLFPLAMKPSTSAGPATVTRKELKKIVRTEHSDNPTSCASLVFAPPQALPHLLDRALNDPKVEPRLSISAHALSGEGKLGTTGAITWDADVGEMRKDLSALGEEINRLEEEQRVCMMQTGQMRRQCSQLAVETSALRMAMFTRRLRHRSNLYSHGVSSSMTVPILAPVGGGSARSNDASGTNAADTADEDEDEVVEEKPNSTLAPSRGAKETVSKGKGKTEKEDSNGTVMHRTGSGSSSSSDNSAKNSTSNGNGSSKDGTSVPAGPRKRTREADVLLADGVGINVTGSRKRVSVGGNSTSDGGGTPPPDSRRSSSKTAKNSEEEDKDDEDKEKADELSASQTSQGSKKAPPSKRRKP